jgi:hypothetical protein
MEKAIRKQRIPYTDSIEELARFWDTHDLTDFEDSLEEVAEPVFEPRKPTSLTIKLEPRECQALRQIARSKGVRDATLLRRWILERLDESSATSRPPNKALHPTARKTPRLNAHAVRRVPRSALKICISAACPQEIGSTLKSFAV